MDTIDEEKSLLVHSNQRFKERSGFWNPSTAARAKSYLAWLEKQANQRQKTLELDGVTHSMEYKQQLRREKAAYTEEKKRIEDMIEDKHWDE